MTTAGWPSIVAVLREQLGSMRNIPRPPVAYPVGGVYEDPALQSKKQQQKMNKRKRKGESTITEDRRYASDHLSKRKALNTFMDSLFFWKKSVCSVFFARRW